MAHSDVYPGREFHPWQVWPGSYDNPLAAGRYPRPASTGLKITRQTRIAAMGSCFTREIKDTLIADGYRFLTAEQEHRAARHASAAWERVYNTFCLRQIVRYSFEEWQPDLRWWVAPRTGVVQDPYRRIVVYPTPAQAEADFARHRLCSRRILEEADVLILTLEMTEIWEDTRDGAVISLPAGPYVAEGGDMDRYRFRVSRYRENLENLDYVVSAMARHNPACTVVLMVSPVHLWTTFREDADVVSACGNAKATLRAAADEAAARHANVVYFPALEIATTHRMIHGRPVFAQGRESFHPAADTVGDVMRELYRFYDADA